DLVGVMLTLDDLADMFGRIAAALQQARGRFGRGKHGAGMGFEQIEEIAGSRQKALKPGEHGWAPRYLMRRDRQAPSAQRRLEFGRGERTDEFTQVRFVHRIGRVGEREPATLTLRLLFPGVELVSQRKREDLHVHHERGAAALALAIAIAAES